MALKFKLVSEGDVTLVFKSGKAVSGTSKYEGGKYYSLLAILHNNILESRLEGRGLPVS